MVTFTWTQCRLGCVRAPSPHCRTGAEPSTTQATQVSFVVFSRSHLQWPLHRGNTDGPFGGRSDLRHVAGRGARGYKYRCCKSNGRTSQAKLTAASAASAIASLSEHTATALATIQPEILAALCMLPNFDIAIMQTPQIRGVVLNLWYFGLLARMNYILRVGVTISKKLVAT